MSIKYGDILKHNNQLFPIVDVEDVKGGTRVIATFSNTDLFNAFNGIPDKLKQNYTNLIVTNTSQHYYLSGTDATITTSWTLTGSGLSALGTTNSIAKWTGSNSLGDSLITDNGDTITINGNLTVIGTSSSISSQNLLVKDPIILLAGSQSTPLFDSGLFINRGTGDTQAFIWDESETEFKFISTTSSSTTMGNVSIGTYSNVRTGVLSVGTGTASNSRFLVSSSGGTTSFLVTESGKVGIGTTNPFESLHSVGNLRIENPTSSSSINIDYISSNTSHDNHLYFNYKLKSGTMNYDWYSEYNPDTLYHIFYHPSTYINGHGSSTYYMYFDNGYDDASKQKTVFQLNGYEKLVLHEDGTIIIGGDDSNSYQSILRSSNAYTYLSNWPGKDLKIQGGAGRGTGVGGSILFETATIGASGSTLNTQIPRMIINYNGNVGIGTTGASASLHITGTSSVYTDSSLLVEDSSKTQLLKVSNNGQIILGDNNFGAVGPGNVKGVFIIGQGTANYGLNTSNPNLLTFIVGSTNATYVSGIQGASVNFGNVRSGIYFTNNASDIVFRAGYYNEYGVLTTQLQERMRIGISGNVSINTANTMSGSKLFIQSSTSSTTIGSNVMLDLYNGDITASGSQVSEMAFSADTTAGLNAYNTQHRYAIISGYATAWNNVVTGGGIKFSTRATTSSSLVTALVVSPNGSVYNDSRGSNTLYGLNALLVSTGINNVAIGTSALQNNLGGLNNTAVGLSSMASNVSGCYNTAVGCQALVGNVLGSDNTAIGISSQQLATQSSSNTSVGRASLYNNLSSGLVAIGTYALTNNTIGTTNTAVGHNSLQANTTTIASLIIVDPGSSYTPSSTYSNIQLSYISGSTAIYPIVDVYVGSTGSVSTITLVTRGSGFKDTTTIMGANLGTGVTFSVSIGSLQSGDANTAVGYQSLLNNTTGDSNTALGSTSMQFNTTGYENTVVGSSTLQINTTGFQNTAVGHQSLNYNTTGYANTSLGYQALWLNSTGTANIAVGYQALWLNTIGLNNIAIGEATMASNKSGNYNVSIGNSILNSATASLSNTVVGSSALQNLLVGNYNTVIGRSSAYNSTTSNGLGGVLSLTQSSNSVYIGADIRPIENQTNQIIIGYGATGSGSNSVTLGASTITKTQLRGTINIGNVPQYASNGAAISGGLVPGDIYQTLSNVLMVVV